ncbi:MAG TPA: ABC transporter permease [Phycisphaerae bacterium]|nr:ABC transporter permease [Phycisphaerae bacterium]
MRIILVLAGRQLRILARMPAILLVIFLPGIVMYSVFTKIFEGPAGVGRPFRTAVIDLDNTPQSRELIDSLKKCNVTAIRTENEAPDGKPLTVESATHQIRKEGKYRVAVVIPNGFSEAPSTLNGRLHKGVRLIYDETQPMEAEAVTGLLQLATGRLLFEKTFKILGNEASQEKNEDADGPVRLLDVEKAGIAIERMQIASKHTFLAGVVPLFLLFASMGAARGMLEELHGGGIRRLLAAPISPAHVLLGQQLYAFVLAMLQCTVMYVYAWLVFGVAIWAIAGGLLTLTVATCLASTGFGMLLASFCRTGEQLDAIGTTVILAMSAVGGSMVPRFIMPAFMVKLGLFTINGWSYDGFIALIRNEGFAGIAPSCLVLLGVAAACATIGSLLLARRFRMGPGA